MTDASFPAVDDDGLQLQAPFLERALEAVLRLVDIYAAERHIQLRMHQVHRPDRAGKLADANPVRGDDALITTSPAGSSAVAEPSGRLTLSNARAVALDEPNGLGNVATKNPRRGWTKGNSTSAQIRAKAAEYLRKTGTRARGSEIWKALRAEGLVINSKDPAALVSARIGRSPLFDHTYEGYGLREWSNPGVK